MKISRFPLLAVVMLATGVMASETITPEPDESSYHFISHYSVDINAPAGTVWNQLLDVGSWMYEFDLLLESGTPGREGEVRRLYEGQKFFIEITKIIPGELLVFAALPSSFKGEHSTGVSVMTLSEAGGTTTVRLTMSRRFSWDSAEPNPQKAMRESPDFQDNTRAMWQERFLGRLRLLVEEN